MKTGHEACRIFRFIVSGFTLAFSISVGCLTPSNAQTAAQYRQQALELSSAKSWDEAIANYHKALELEPNLPDAHNNIANLLKATDRRDEAIAEYRIALQLRPDYPEVRNNLGASLE